MVLLVCELNMDRDQGSGDVQSMEHGTADRGNELRCWCGVTGAGGRAVTWSGNSITELVQLV